MKSQTVKITSLSPAGHGISDNGWHILGAFPGDTVHIKPYKQAENITYAELLKIIEPSQHRSVTPDQPPFFDPNAPWQHLKIDSENEFKKNLVRKIFEIQGIDIHSDILQPGKRTENYRNKAAYAFTKNKNNTLSFALFTRGVAQSGKISQSENILVRPAINTIGKQFLHFFNQKQVPLELLKYLNLRYSYFTDTVVAQILITETNRKKIPWKKSELESLIENNKQLQGVLVSHSEPGIRSSVTTKDFYEIGNITTTEKILEKEYTYHPSQFFQIYPDAFAQILIDTENLIKNIPNHQNYELLDFFAGIGIIGLHLANLVHQVHGVEQSPLAKEYALQNAKINNISNFTFTQANVDQALDHIQSKQILIVDPARSGLTRKSREKIIEQQPEYIIYISCNPETQARDFAEMRKYYDIEWSRGYNLFPKTPHIEHVLFLKRKN